MLIYSTGTKKEKPIENMVVNNKKNICQFADEDGIVLFQATGTPKRTKYGKTMVYKELTPRNKYWHAFSEYERKKLTPSLRAQVLDRDNFTCQHCGAKAPDVELHVDHVVPIAKGGITEMANLQALCAKCNLGKGDKFDK